MLSTRFLPHNAIWLIAVLAIWGACGSEVADNVVARIADREITAAELLQFRADTPALLRSEQEGVEALKDYVQTLIDMELILLEAQALQLERDVDFARRWEEERKRKLIFEFQLREIMGKVEVSPEQMMERYAKSKWSHMVQLARIRVKTLEEAEQVVRELEGGGDFAGLALERSVDQETARLGGRLDYFLGRNELAERGFSLEIAEELFELEVGAFSRPYRKGDVYEVFQVVDQRPAPPGYAMVFTRTRLAQEFYTLRRALLDTLSREYEVRCESAGIAFAITRLSAATNAPPLSPSEEEMVLCHLRDGQIEMKDLFDVLLQDGALTLGAVDSATVARSIRNHLLPEALFYRTALRKGIAQDSSVVAWLATKKQEMLVEAVKDRAVDRQIDLSEEAVRRYYEDHLDRFMGEVEIQIVEILVQSREEAEELLGRVGRGESMEELAVRHSIRKGARHTGGRLHMHPGKRGLYGELHAAVMQAEEGALLGPVKIGSAVPGGYSVFKVVEKIPPNPLPFGQAARRVRYWLRQEEEARNLQTMFEELRDKYAGKIDIFEEHLKAMVGSS